MYTDCNILLTGQLLQFVPLFVSQHLFMTKFELKYIPQRPHQGTVSRESYKTVKITISHRNSCELMKWDNWHGILLNRKLLFSLPSQTWQGRKSMHCPHKSPQFPSAQEPLSLAPDILQLSFCLEDCSANHMFINGDKQECDLISNSFVVQQ